MFVDYAHPNHCTKLGQSFRSCVCSGDFPPRNPLGGHLGLHFVGQAIFGVVVCCFLTDWDEDLYCDR